ncbi:Cytoplasmic dynein 2 heavy chain 1 [Borealophlyctis nickersoniae]|nr:Cytoplasmic dynein 2 heavy chain 1 [Borealophlyctis nickersoniae]
MALSSPQAWVQSAISLHIPSLSSSAGSDWGTSLQTDPEIRKLVEEEREGLVFIWVDENSQTPRTSSTPPPATKTSPPPFTLALSKTAPVAITTASEAATYIRVTPLGKPGNGLAGGGVVESLWESIHGVFLNVLVKNPPNAVPTNVQDLVSELDAGLGASLRHQNARGGGMVGSSKDDAASLTHIQCVTDEYMYWCELEVEGGRAEREKSQIVKPGVEGLKGEFEKLSALPLAQVPDDIPSLQDHLEDLARAGNDTYPTPRLMRLVGVIGEGICDGVRKHLGGKITADVKMKEWTHAVKICESWDQVVTAVVVAGVMSGHAFPAPPPVTSNTPIPALKGNQAWKDEKFVKFWVRVVEVHTLLTTHATLTTLCPTESTDALTAFANIDALNCSIFGEKAWKTALQTYTSSTSSLDSTIASTLRNRFAALVSSSVASGSAGVNMGQGLLREFKRYKGVVGRDGVRRGLGKFFIWEDWVAQLAGDANN